MPYIKKSREQAIADGTYKLHPERYPEVPVSGHPLGNPPEHMDDGPSACWFEISSYLPPSVLTGGDRIALEMASELLWGFRQSPQDFPTSKLATMINLMARFGMTPADRNKLGGQEKSKPKGNAFGGLDD